MASGLVSTQADSGQPLAIQRLATVAEAVDVLFPRRGQIAVVVGTHDRRGALGFTHNQGSEDA